MGGNDNGARNCWALDKRGGGWHHFIIRPTSWSVIIRGSDDRFPLSAPVLALSSGRLDLSGRLVMLPHGTAMVRDGIPTDDDIAYYAARARGLGLVITGATVATPDAAFRARILTEGWNADARAMMQRRCDVVHAAGARIVGQLCHLGRESTGMESEYAPKGPSAIRSPRDPWPPQEMDERQILAFIDGFADAALNLQAVEL
jgi:2,4-dienoyl-CoA reductase (NADPH2)